MVDREPLVSRRSRVERNVPCLRCKYEPPVVCEIIVDERVCGERFSTRRHLAAHNRYSHGVGMRRPNPDGTPAEPPKVPTPAYLSPNAVRVAPKTLALPWIATPNDAETCLAIRQTIIIRMGPRLHLMSPRERRYWESVIAHFQALPEAIAQQRELEEQGGRQRIRTHMPLASMRTAPAMLG